jgi:hypothetical protein
MDEAEFWLLDVVVEGRVHLDWLLWDELDVALNRPVHGLDPDALLDLVDRLFRGGFIDAWELRCSDDREDMRRSLDRSEIEAALHGCGPGFAYGMTARGGARWEAVTKPDWSRFIEESAGLDPDEVEAAGLDRDRVASFIRQHTLWAVVPDSERWETPIPWEATYWKTFPRGYRVTTGWQREAPDKERDWDAYKRWMQWYTNPFEA